MAVSSYTTESNEDTFKADTVFESFLHQAKILISDRALLAGFLMLWLKRCVMPTLRYDVLTADIIYPTVLLSHGQPLGLLSAMLSCLQSELCMLTWSFYRVEVMEDEEGNAILDRNCEPKRKTPNPRMELPYTYMAAWYVMHCPALMSAV